MSEKVRLFFTAGKVPTEAEKAAAAALGMTCFRNSQRVGTLETADEVAGAVPEGYAKVKGVKVVTVPQPSQPQQQSKR